MKHVWRQPVLLLVATSLTLLGCGLSLTPASAQFGMDGDQEGQTPPGEGIPQDQAPEAPRGSAPSSPALLKTIEELKATLERSEANSKDVTDRLIKPGPGKSALPGDYAALPARPRKSPAYFQPAHAQPTYYHPGQAQSGYVPPADTPGQQQQQQRPAPVPPQPAPKAQAASGSPELEAALAQSEQEKRALADKYQALQGRELQLQQQLHLLREQKRRDEMALQATGEQSREKELEQLRSTQSKSDAGKQQLNVTVQTLKQEKLALQQRLAEIERTSQATTAAAAAYKAEATKIFEIMRAGLTDRDAQNKAMAKELQQLKAAAPASTGGGATDADRAKLAKALETARAEIAGLQANNRSLSERLVQAQRNGEQSPASASTQLQLSKQLSEVQAIALQSDAQRQAMANELTQLRVKTKSQLSAMDSERSKLAQSLTQAQMQVSELLAAKQAQAAQLEQIQKATQDNAAAHQSQLQAVKSAKAQVEDKYKRLLDENTELAAKLQSAETSVNADKNQAMKALTEAQTTISRLMADKSNLSKQVMDLQAAHQAELAETQKSYQNDLAQAADNKSHLSQQVSGAQATVAKLQLERDQLAAQLSQAQTLAAQLQKQVDDGETARASQKESLSQQLRELDTRLAQAAQEKQELLSEIAQLKVDPAPSGWEEEKTHLAQALSEANARLSKSQIQEQALTAQLVETRKHLEAQARLVAQFKLESNKQLTDAQLQHQQIDSQKQALAAECAQLKARLNQTAAQQGEKEKLAQVVRESQVALTQALAGKRDLQAKLERLQKQYAEESASTSVVQQQLSKQADEAISRAQALDHERQRLSAALSEQAAKSTSAGKQEELARALELEREKLTRLLSESTEQVTVLTKTNEALTDKLKQQQRDLDNAGQEMERERSELAARAKENSFGTSDEKKEMSKSIDALTKRLEKADSERHSLTSQISQLLDQIVQMQAQNLASKTASMAERELLVKAANDAKKALANADSSSSGRKGHKEKLADKSDDTTGEKSGSAPALAAPEAAVPH